MRPVLLLAALLTSSLASAVAQQAGRPVVVFVHGRAQQKKAPDSVPVPFFRGFEGGLAGIGAGGQLEANVDYVMADYAHLYRKFEGRQWPACALHLAVREAALAPLRAYRDSVFEALSEARGELSGGGGGAAASADSASATSEDRQVRPPEAAPAADLEAARRRVADLEAEFERAELALTAESERLAAEAASRDSTERVRGLGFLDRVKDYVREHFGNNDKLVRLSLRLLMQDTREYLTDANARCATNAAVEAVLNKHNAAGRPVVLVAHSMGGLVSYDVLLGDEGRQVDRDLRLFVAIGSPLGVAPIMRFFQKSTPWHLPDVVPQLLSFRAFGDVVPAKPVAHAYDRGVVDAEIVSRSEDRHDPHGYLENRAVVSPILAAWCGAFPNGLMARRPAACGALPPAVKTPPGARRN